MYSSFSCCLFLFFICLFISLFFFKLILFYVHSILTALKYRCRGRTYFKFIKIAVKQYVLHYFIFFIFFVKSDIWASHRISGISYKPLLYFSLRSYTVFSSTWSCLIKQDDDAQTDVLLGNLYMILNFRLAQTTSLLMSKHQSDSLGKLLQLRLRWI